MSLSAGWIWIYVGCGLMLAELLAPGFVIFFFGLAAATVGALVLIMPDTFQLNLTWQLAFFSLFSIVYLVTLRRYMKSVFCGDTSAVAVLEDEYVGRIGVITEAIQPNWIGRVRIGDAEWDATSSVALTVGEEVRVVSRANLTLNVEPSSGTSRECSSAMSIRQVILVGVLCALGSPVGAQEDVTQSLESPAITNVLNVLHTVAITNVVTVVKTNVVNEVIVNPEITATTNLVTRTFKLYNANADDLATRFNNMWTGDFGSLWKISKVAQSFPEANAVMVTAPQRVMDACEEIVRDVDREPAQVYIEARFVELSSSAMHKLGIDWSMLESMKGSASLGGGIRKHDIGKGVTEFKKTIESNGESTSYSLAGGTKSDGGFTSTSDGAISYFNGTLDFGQMYLMLSALERENDVRIFSNPKIIVASGHKATVDMTTKYPNVSIAAKKTINNNNESVDLDMKMASIPGEDSLMFAKEAFFSWGISLEVTPRVGTNGIINVMIVPTISSLTSDGSLGGQFVTAGTSSRETSKDSYSAKYPIIDVQRLVTDFSMKSGMTAVIGGLSKTTEEQMDSGIPWLRDIPWIGNKLFGGKSRQKVQKEILVFVSVGLAGPNLMATDTGLPRNAVLGREYTEGIRREPGDRRFGVAAATALDLRSLEEQVRDPRRTNRTEKASVVIPMPFMKVKD